MTESTARAERFDPQTSPSPFYTWGVAQKPVSVRIPHSLMDRLEKDAVDSFRSLSARGSEIGGLLVGSVAPGNPMVVSLSDYEIIPCDYSRGPLYRLSDADMGRFERVIQQRVSAGSTVAGFFRSHTRKGMSLDADDLTFFEQRFRDPHQLVLLVRPYATKTSIAGIFIWEGGKVRGEASHLEFPFRSSELAASKLGTETGESRLLSSSASIPPPLAPKAPARAQIVPIASRREISLPPPPPADTPAPVAAPAVATPPDTATAETAKVADPPAVKISAPTTDQKPARIGQPAAPLKAAVAEKSATAAAAEAVEELPAPGSNKVVKLLVAAAATIAIFVALFVYPGLLRHSSKITPGASQDSSALQLRVERAAGELLLTWNRDADAIKDATKGVLSISDGGRQENVELDLTQLRTGSIVYAPQSTDISFKMEVTGKGQNKFTSESVRILRTRPSPMQEQGQRSPASGPQPAPGDANLANDAQAGNSPSSSEEPVALEDTKPATPTALKPFEPLAQRLRPVTSTDLPEAPTVSGGGAVSAAVPGVNVNAVMAGPAAPVPPAPVSTQEIKTPAKPGGQIQQATLIYKKDPEYPKIARQTGAKGQVKLVATIGKDGRVKGVKVVSGHPMLQGAASEAVRQWIYKPTILNGLPIETETEILVNFMGER